MYCCWSQRLRRASLYTANVRANFFGKMHILQPVWNYGFQVKGRWSRQWYRGHLCHSKQVGTWKFAFIHCYQEPTYHKWRLRKHELYIELTTLLMHATKKEVIFGSWTVFWPSLISIRYTKKTILRYSLYYLENIWNSTLCVQISGGDDKKSPWIMMGHARDQTWHR